MTQELAQPTVTDSELLARFVTVRKWVRADQTFRLEAFVPRMGTDLSVTRHKNLSNDQIWQIGREICENREPPDTLYGRGDLRAESVRQEKLEVEAKPLPENLNHAEITRWPADKAARKSLGQLLAAQAVYTLRPGRLLAP